MKKYAIVSCLVASVVLYNSCARNPVTGKRQVVLMSEEQEIAMGREADPQIVAHFGLYNDSSLQRFISQEGQKMAAISHRPGLKYEFKILDTDVLNAFAVPGGYVYFTRGIMAHFNNEAEFAGVLGHEIGHITARHSVVQQRNQILGQLGIIAGVIISPELGQFAEAASQGLGLLFLKFGRDAERESDALGVEYSTKIGYDATEMAEFFNTLERKGAESGAGQIPAFLSTHPNPGERTETVARLAREWKQKLNLTSPIVNRDRYLQRIEGMIYGQDPKQGFVESNVFYHPVLKFQFPIPANWQYLNSPSNVQLASRDGKALMVLSLAQGQTLQEAANTILQQYQLTLVESQQITVNGLPALAMIADQRPQQQQQQQQQAALRTQSYLIQYDGRIYHLIGVSGLNDFNNYRSFFNNTMQNFRPLTDVAKLNRQPERIRIRTAKTTTSLANALRENGVTDRRLDEHAILNGMKLTDNIPQGTYLKIIAQ